MSTGSDHYETKSGSLRRISKNNHNSDFETEKTSTASNSESEGSKKKSPPTWKSYVILTVILGIYIGFNFLGSYVFMALERRTEAGSYHWFNKYKEDFVRNVTKLTMDELEDFLKMVQKAMDDDVSTIVGNESIFEEKWTISSGFLLSFTIASTIGYGTVTPVTAGGQVFCIIFALLSIPFTGLLAAKIGSLMAYSIKRTTGIIFFQNKNNRRVKIASILFTFFVGLLIYLLIPTLILLFVSNEEQWTFIECLYCVFVTLTTIGFGDYVPDPGSSGGMLINVFVLVWVVAGLAWFATIVQLIANVFTKQASSFKKRVAHPHMAMKSLRSATATFAGRARTRSSKTSQSSAEAGEIDRGQVASPNQGHSEDEATEENNKNQQDKRTTPNGVEFEIQPTGGRNVAENSTSKSTLDDGTDGTDRTPHSSNTPQIARVARHDSLASKGSKQDEDVVLGPSGFLAIIMNNMEDYEAPESDKSGSEH